MILWAVVWSEVDSGHNILAAYRSEKRAKEEAEALNEAGRLKALEESLAWVDSNDYSMQVYSSCKTKEEVKDHIRAQFNTSYYRTELYGQHGVERIEVKE